MEIKSQHELTDEERYDRDYFAFTRISQKWRELERTCRQSCWFDYRFLHPYDATLLYIQAYNTVYRDIYRKYFDARTAEHLRIAEPEAMLANFDKFAQTIRGCWHGRIVADSMGIPYEAFIKDAFEIRLRYWKQRYPPRATMLYPQLVIDQMPAKWEDRQKARMQFSTHPNYLSEVYDATPAQKDHHKWILGQAEMRPDPAGTRDWFTDNHLLRPAAIEERFFQAA